MIIEKTKITPSKYQSAIYDEILNTNRNIVVRATAGCLHPDTPILMYNGTIKLASTIQVNDLLMGPDSQPRCVLKINQGQDIMYKIVPQKGMSWICNSKHILTVHNEYIANSIKKYKNTHHKSPLQDIDLSKLLKVSKVTISKNIKTDFLSQYRLQRTGVEFYNFNTPIPPYLMGLWLGDDTVNQSNITTKDQVIIDYCKSLKLSKITCKVIPDKNCFTIRFSGKGGIRSNIFRNEVLQAYSNKQKFIPKKYLINSTENRLQLLAGLIDSDGYLGTNVYEICSKFESLKDDILFLCRSLGLAAYATYSKRTIKSLKFESWYWIISISGELSNIPCLLERKKAKPRKQIKSVLRTGFKIEEIGIGDWCGFQVDRDNRFLLGDFTITHNSGKTTTIVESTKLIPHGKEAIFTAFNKSIAEELSKRLPSHILCSTIHSIGMRALLTHYRTKLMVNEYKSFNFLKEVSSNDTLPEELKKSPEEFAEYQYRMRSAVDLVRMTLTDIQPGPIMDICNHYGVDILEYEVEDVINVIKKYDLYNRGLCRRFNAIDYVDMIYVPILNPKIKLPQFDFVFIDEAQDLNRCQQEFIERLKKPNGRTIIVGDPRQSIYSFMGSDPQSFENFLRKPNTIELPLSTCYRCGTEIVKLAKSVYPEIEPFENNPPGEIRYGELEEADQGDFILSRNNRPLVYVYFELLEKGKNPIIVGKDIQEGLEALVNKVIKKSVDEGMAILQERLEQLKAELKEKGIKNIKANPRYEALNDKILTISIIANRFETMKEVKEQITKMFENKESCIILTTIHKSKGLEADRVFIIERFDGMRLLPSPYAITEWQRVQEQNLKFVAITRAKKALIFIPNIDSQ